MPTKNKRTTVSDLFKGIDELMTSSVTHEEMQEILTEISSFIKDLKAVVNEKMSQNKSEMTAETARLGKQVSEFESRLRKFTETLNTKTVKNLETSINELHASLGFVEDGLETHEHPNLIEGINNIKAILDSLEIPEAFDATELVEKTEDHEEQLENHKKRIDALEKRPVGGGGGGGVRRILQPYLDDFTDDTDGSTKTFYLSREPLQTDNIEVHCTDFPIILRPSTDFTVTGKTLTLTGAVPAPTEGATLLIKFYA